MDGIPAQASLGSEPSHRDMRAHPHPTASAAPVRVFLVEDSPKIRERLVEGISMAGKVEVVGCADTEAGAQDSLARLDCDVVVLDLDLKQGNGLRVLQWLRAGSTRTRPVVIVFTNYVMSHYRTQSLRLGADFFFDKARDFDRVLEVIQGVAPEA
ncbi:MAG TPA: response regulator [Burkholderiales bacterium]|nr:response regulator [Burkholderiales bacterium]